MYDDIYNAIQLADAATRATEVGLHRLANDLQTLARAILQDLLPDEGNDQ